jgi:predicted dienelactone hydrolase
MVSVIGLAPGWSAETVTFAYGALERSIAIRDLEIYVQEGRITPELQSYARYFARQNVEQVRTLLNQPADLDLLAVDRFLYTAQGEYLLNIVGDIIRTASRLNGFSALRGALILSAADTQEGLTLLNIMRRFPSQTIRVDLAKGLAIAREVDRAVYQSKTAITGVEQAANAALSQPPPELIPQLTLATQPGPYTAERLVLQNTTIPADIYLPLSPASRLPLRPAIVISHGLGSDSTSYAYLAEHLVSYGFVVISVEHPGSSAEQIKALLAGRAADVVPDSEFIQRPEKISRLLDELEKRARTDPKLWGRINFQQIGILGQSFGGYTSLALAGAPLDFSELQANCPPQVFSLNVSLLLQCQAEKLQQPGESRLSLADDRIQAAIAINPITSVLFGPASLGQIRIPVMIVAGGADTVAPALPEQIIPFSWLTTAHKYLLMMSNGTHFSTIGPSETNSEAFTLPNAILGPPPSIAQDYLKAMSLAFFETYLDNNANYQVLLSSDAAHQLSQAEIPLSLIQATPTALGDESNIQPRQNLAAEQ